MRLAVSLLLAAALVAACGESARELPSGGTLAPQSAPAAIPVFTRSYVSGFYLDSNPDGIPAQVYRLYSAAFGREPDSGGLGYHVGNIEVLRHTLIEVAENFMASPEFGSRYGTVSTSQFVTLLYANVLHREPDAGGLAFHVGNIDQGVYTRAQVLMQFSESGENRTQTAAAIAAGITFKAWPATRIYLTDGVYVETDPNGNAATVFRLYQSVFGRAADPGGLGFHVGSIEAKGVPLAQVAQNFMASPEFSSRYGQLNSVQFITQLYQNVLHREPDAGGLDYYKKLLEGGASRVQVLLGFSESPENRTQTASAVASGLRFVPYPSAPDMPAIDPLAPLPPFGLALVPEAWGIEAAGVGGDSAGDGGVGGGAGDGAPIRNAKVVLVDSQGHVVEGSTDSNGQYLLRFNTAVFHAPYVVRVIDAAGNVLTSTSDEPAAAGKVVRMNVNPLTDKITSDVLAAGVLGTDKDFNGSAIVVPSLARARAELNQSIALALAAAGVSDAATFDVVRSPYAQNGTGVDAVIESLIHTRDPVTGATQLREKLASPDSGTAAVTASTPLPASQVVLPGSPALTFEKLTAWMDFMNSCFTAPAPSYTANVPGIGTCTPAQLSAAISPTFRDRGVDAEVFFEQLYMDGAGGEFLPGAQLRNPQVLYVDRYPGSTSDDMAVVEFTLYLPKPELAFDGTDPVNQPTDQPWEYTLRATFKRDDATPGLAAKNWVLHGDQRQFFWAVNPQYESRTQVNPARDVNATGQDPSYMLSRLSFSLNFNRISTRSQSLALTRNSVYAVRVKGPGYPAAGVVFTPSDNTTAAAACMHNKSGIIPAPGTLCEFQSGLFTVSQIATTSGAIIDPGLWVGNRTSSARSLIYADSPSTADFSQFKPFGVYTAEIFVTDSASPVVEQFRMVPAFLSPALAAKLPRHDMSPSVALVTPTNGSASPFTFSWVRTPGAMNITGAQAISFDSISSISNNPVPTSTLLMPLGLDYYPSKRSVTSITLPGTMEAQTAAKGRQLRLQGSLGRTFLVYQLEYTP